MTVTIGFVSEKGGVGKTTTVLHVAVGLARFHGKKVLVVDTDYQRGGLTCRMRPEMLEAFQLGQTDYTTLYQVYQAFYSDQDQLPDLTVLSTEDEVDLVPADPRLNSISVDKMPPTNNLRENNRMLIRHLGLIRESLQSVIDSGDPYDFILIDSHPDLDDLERSVIYASDYCISPVKLDDQSAPGVPSITEAIRNVDEDMRTFSEMPSLDLNYEDTEFIGAVGMMCREWGGILKASERVIFRRLRLTAGILNSYVTEGDGIRQAAENRVTVYDIDGANAEKQSEQFERLIDEILQYV